MGLIVHSLSLLMACRAAGYGHIGATALDFGAEVAIIRTCEAVTRRTNQSEAVT